MSCNLLSTPVGQRGGAPRVAQSAWARSVGTALGAVALACSSTSALATDLGSDMRIGDASVSDGPIEFPSSATFVHSTTSRSGSPLRWMGSNCIYLRANSAGSADIDDGSDLRAVESAARRWEGATASCSYMRFNVLEPSPDAFASHNSEGLNECVIQWVESDWPHDRTAQAITALFFVDNPSHSQYGRILDADIELNGSFKFSTTGDPGATDIENTVVHELGHLLGLDHTCDDGQRERTPMDNVGETIPPCRPEVRLPEHVTEATMYNFADPGETKKRSPEIGDIHGICTLYPIDDDPGVCRPVILAKPNAGCDVVRSGSIAPYGPFLLAFLLGLAVWLPRGLRRLRAASAAGR